MGKKERKKWHKNLLAVKTNMKFTFNYKCAACRTESPLTLTSTHHIVQCPACGSPGYYWNEQFDHNYVAPPSPKTCLVVPVFWPEKLQNNFLRTMNEYDAGIDHDIVFVHNSFNVKEVENRQHRDQETAHKLYEVISSYEREDKIVLSRKNVGEDLGACRHAFNLLKNNYDYFFFANEGCRIQSDGWLSEFINFMKENPKVVACGPKVIKKPNPIHKYIVCSTYWGMKSSFGKTLVWPEPTNRPEAKSQEMELLWRRANEQGYYIAQVGTGANLLHSKVDPNLCCGPGVY